MLQALSSPQNRVVSSALIALCCVFALAARAVGIADNPPGILLAYLASAAAVLAFVHPWRTSRRFRLLFYGSFVGLAAFGVAHNLLEALAHGVGGQGPFGSVLEGLGVAAFLVAVLGFPPAFLVGAVGWIVTAIHEHHGGSAGAGAPA